VIRTLYTYPGPVDFGVLLSELRSVEPTIIDCNDVGGQVAVYSNEVVDGAVVASVVAAHAGPASPPVDPLHALAQAIVSAESLEDLKPVAQQILSDGDT
jgi:hypothetical protein